MCHHIYYLLNLFYSATLALPLGWITLLLDFMNWRFFTVDPVMYHSACVYWALTSMPSAPLVFTETSLRRQSTYPRANRLVGETPASRQLLTDYGKNYNEDVHSVFEIRRKKPSKSALASPERLPRGGHAWAEAYRLKKYVLGRWSEKKHSSRGNNLNKLWYSMVMFREG